MKKKEQTCICLLNLCRLHDLYFAINYYCTLFLLIAFTSIIYMLGLICRSLGVVSIWRRSCYRKDNGKKNQAVEQPHYNYQEEHLRLVHVLKVKSTDNISA